MCVVYTFLAGNLLCVWAFNKKDVELKRSFANLLNCLAIFDSLFLTCLLLQYSLPTLSEHYLVCIAPFVYTKNCFSSDNSFSLKSNSSSAKAVNCLLKVWLLPHVTPVTLPIMHITQTASVYTVIIENYTASSALPPV